MQHNHFTYSFTASRTGADRLCMKCSNAHCDPMRPLQSSRWGEVVLNVIKVLIALTEGDPCGTQCIDVLLGTQLKRQQQCTAAGAHLRG